jgi:hypothetical protein
MPLHELAAVLNEEGRASRSGKRWTAPMVRDLLSA